MIVTQLVKNSSTFYKAWVFITVFTRAHDWTLSWATWIQSISISLRSISILSSHLCLHLQIGLFPSSFQTKILYASYLPNLCPANLIPLDFITLNNICWSVQIMELLVNPILFSLLLLPPSYVQYVLTILF
jgi:hypothetical protein